MQAYCCPRCQSLSYPGLMGFPRCHKCHEQLRQCRYCRHQTGGLCALPPDAAPPLEEESGRPFCRAFESRLVVAQTTTVWRRPLTDRARSWTTIALGVAALLLFLSLARRHELLPPLIEPDAAKVAVLDRHALAEFTVTADPERFDDIELRIDPGVLKGYSFEEAEPPPVSTNRAELPSLHYRVPPSGALRVRLSFFARAHPPAYLPLRVQVIALGEAVSEAKTTLVATSDLAKETGR